MEIVVQSKEKFYHSIIYDYIIFLLFVLFIKYSFNVLINQFILISLVLRNF
jgi:hypothetical protein